MITRDTQLADIAKHFHKVMCSCGAIIGEHHQDECDVARCTECLDQAWVSECDEWHPDIWTGWWPGTIEAIHRDLWSYFGPDYGERGWVKCGPDDPRGTPDLNEVSFQLQIERRKERTQ